MMFNQIEINLSCNLKLVIEKITQYLICIIYFEF